MQKQKYQMFGVILLYLGLCFSLHLNGQWAINIWLQMNICHNDNGCENNYHFLALTEPHCAAFYILLCFILKIIHGLDTPLYTFHRWVTGGLERLSNLPKITQLDNKTYGWNQICRVQFVLNHLSASLPRVATGASTWSQAVSCQSLPPHMGLHLSSHISLPC